MAINRRDFLRGVAGVSGAALTGSVSVDAFATQDDVFAALPSPEKSGIEHIVVVMMENRSFDHFFGWVPKSNGRQAGLSYEDSSGVKHPTHRLTSFTGCPHPDPDHSYQGGRDEFDNGKMDGWLRTTTNDLYCIGYYLEQDLPFWSPLVRNYTTLDRYFASILSSTFPNRVFSHAAQTDRLSNTLTLSTLPTIWDSLASAGVSNKYYYSNVPFLALWGEKYIPISAFYAEFLADALAGTLPSVSFVDPAFTILDDGEGNDDHPHADIRAGEAFVSEIFQAITNGPGWANTVLIINRDEWGGFFDTAVPPRAIAPNDVDTDLVDGKALLGCRVPVVIVSPFATGTPDAPRINSSLYEHTSVLKLIEWRYGLKPLTARDASNQIANLALALDFANPNTAVPSVPIIKPPVPTPCGGGGVLTTGNESYDFYELLKSPLMAGWPLPSGLP